MQLFEKAKDLADTIKLYKAHSRNSIAAESANESWGVSYFYLAVLAKSELSERFLITGPDLNVLATEFETAHGVTIDLTKLFDKAWLRLVCGNVEIPKIVGQAIHQLQRLETVLAEISFFASLTNERRKAINSMADLQTEAQTYSQTHGITLDLTTAEKVLYSINHEGKVDVYNADLAKYIADNLHDFRFLAKIYELHKNRKFFITKVNLEAVHRAHKAYFTACPELDHFIAKEVFQLDETEQYYVIGHFNENDDETRQQVAALLWKQIIEDTRFSSDTERLHFWYYRTVYYSNGFNTLHFLSGTPAARFREAALKLLNDEPDITTGDIEYRKLVYDGHGVHVPQIMYDTSKWGTVTSTDDLYDMYVQKKWLSNGHGDDLLVEQHCRHMIDHFVLEIVLNDPEYKFKDTFALFHAGGKKPYLFWKACFWVSYWRPEMIPFLLQDKRTGSLCINLLYELNISNTLGTKEVSIRHDIIRRGFQLLLDWLAQLPQVTDEEKALVVFQCLLTDTNKKFNRKGGNPYYQKLYQDEQIRLSDNLREELRNTVLPGTVYSSERKFQHLFYPSMLPELFKLVSTYEAPDPYQNGLIGLPETKLDLLSFLSELGEQINNEGNRVGSDEQLSEFATAFSSTYLDGINKTEVLKKDFETGELKLALPSWRGRFSNNSIINWGAMLLRLEQSFLLDDFLTPRELTFQKADSTYDEYNRYTAEKLRNHLSVLIEAYNGIFRERKNFELKGYPVEQTLTKIESSLTTFVTKHCLFDNNLKRYDIFDEGLERWSMGDQKQELLPAIGVIINRFKKENRQKIINELIKSEQLIRSLKMIDNVVGEKERNKLLETVINEKDLKEILNALSFSDTQFAVQTLSKNRALIKQAEAAIEYLDAKRAGRKRRLPPIDGIVDDDLFYFRMRLLVAYHKGDAQAILTIDEPEVQPHQGINPRNEKEFYEALVLLEKDEPQKAYDIFSRQLSHAKDERPVLALNRFASKLRWADLTSELTEKQKLFQEALNEWNKFEASASSKDLWPDIGEKVTANKLSAYNGLGMDAEFEKLYDELEPEIRLRPSFLQIRIDYLQKRKMQAQSEQLLFEAKQFHELQNGVAPPFIIELENLIQTPETVGFLKEQYLRIFRLAPEELIKVIPDNINDGKNLSQFILNEIAESADQMLRKINTLSNVDHEDKYSELLMLVLNNRVVNYQWYVASVRAAHSDENDATKIKTEKNNLGEIDFGLHLRSGELFAVCEALILYGKNTTEVQKHNLKIFNYSHSRKLFYVISYYKGPGEEFTSAWKKYLSTVEDFIEFPPGYELNGKLKQLNHAKANASVKIARSLHGTDTELFHIFVNINYKIELKKKKVGSTKKGGKS